MQYCLSDLLDRAGAWPRDKAIRTSLRRLTFSPLQRRVMFLAVSTEDYSSPAGHVVSLFYPKAGRLDRLFRTGRLTPLNQICRVGCSCEAWLFWGAAYKSTQQNYRLPGQEWAEDRAPIRRDPAGEYWICKHVIRVAENLKGVSFGELAASGNLPTPQHAQASLDAIRPLLEAASGDAGSELVNLHPNQAESALDRLGFLCEAT